MGVGAWGGRKQNHTGINQPAATSPFSSFKLSPLSAVFLTGSDRIPIHGMESLRIVIQSTTAQEHYLPVAHTCYNLLDMPRYQTKETVRRRLTQAVEQYEGFSLV